MKKTSFSGPVLAILFLVAVSGFDMPRMVGKSLWRGRVSSGIMGSLRSELRGGGEARFSLSQDGGKGPIISEVSDKVEKSDQAENEMFKTVWKRRRSCPT
jgi:hypothetical protein